MREGDGAFHAQLVRGDSSVPRRLGFSIYSAGGEMLISPANSARVSLASLASIAFSFPVETPTLGICPPDAHLGSRMTDAKAAVHIPQVPRPDESGSVCLILERLCDTDDLC